MNKLVRILQTSLNTAKRTLLVATDGLFKSTSAERIVGTGRERRPDVAVQQPIELLRYPSGALPDDVTIIISPLSA
jgi:hypothetical protein